MLKKNKLKSQKIHLWKQWWNLLNKNKYSIILSKTSDGLLREDIKKDV